jgi:hypothetical protein
MIPKKLYNVTYIVSGKQIKSAVISNNIENAMVEAKRKASATPGAKVATVRFSKFIK